MTGSEAVDDYVGPDNPVRFIEAFADGLDLGAAGFVRVQPKATGRPGYDPADLLKLYIYRYLNRIQTATAAMEALGVERIEAVADRGYFEIEDIETCEAAGVTAYVPKPIRGSTAREGFFGKDVFRYEPDRDVLVCPAGAALSPRYRGKSRDNVKVDYANRDACKA